MHVQLKSSTLKEFLILISFWVNLYVVYHFAGFWNRAGEFIGLKYSPKFFLISITLISCMFMFLKVYLSGNSTSLLSFSLLSLITLVFTTMTAVGVYKLYNAYFYQYLSPELAVRTIIGSAFLVNRWVALRILKGNIAMFKNITMITVLQALTVSVSICMLATSNLYPGLILIFLATLSLTPSILVDWFSCIVSKVLTKIYSSKYKIAILICFVLVSFTSAFIFGTITAEASGAASRAAKALGAFTAGGIIMPSIYDIVWKPKLDAVLRPPAAAQPIVVETPRYTIKTDNAQFRWNEFNNKWGVDGSGNSTVVYDKVEQKSVPPAAVLDSLASRRKKPAKPAKKYSKYFGPKKGKGK